MADAFQMQQNAVNNIKQKELLKASQAAPEPPNEVLKQKELLKASQAAPEPLNEVSKQPETPE